MAGTEAFSRVKIDARLTDVGWPLTDRRSVHFEYTLGDGTRTDYVLADRHGRSMAVVEAKKASINHGEPTASLGGEPHPFSEFSGPL